MSDLNSPLTSTPVAASKIASLRNPDLRKIKEPLEIEMRDKWLFVTVDKFLSMTMIQSKLPDQAKQMEIVPIDLATFSKGVQSGGREHKLYPHLIGALQRCFDAATEEVTPGRKLVALQTANHADTSQNLPEEQYLTADGVPQTESDHNATEAYGKMPDISIYPRNEKGYYNLTQEGSSNPQTQQGHLGRTSWSEMLAFVEVKTDVKAFKMAPTDFKAKGVFPDSADAKQARGQLAQYAAEIFLRQHRTWIYSVFVWRNYARLIRWDRAGALVSDPIDYAKEPSKLLSFFYALAIMTDKERGFDPSVTVASDEHQKLWDELCKAEKSDTTAVGRLLRRANRHPWPVYRLQVNDIDVDAKTDIMELPEKCIRFFLVRRHEYGFRSPTGRGSRGFIALETHEKKFYFLKDSWPHTSYKSEFSIYRDLHRCGVQNIPQQPIGGPVLVQEPAKGSGLQWQQSTTNMHLFRELLTAVEKTHDGNVNDAKTDDPVIFDERRHVRFALKEVGHRLKDYANSKELVTVMRDAVEAHQQAWEIANILHRDISDNNIIIIEDAQSKTRKGLLIDWDLAKRKEDLDKPVSRASRSGTWRFRSAHCVLYPLKPYDYSDDLESFALVFAICGFRFHAHGMSSSQLEDYVMTNFDKYIAQEGGLYVGSHLKREALSTLVDNLSRFTKRTSTPFVRLLEELHEAITIQDWKVRREQNELLLPFGPQVPEVDSDVFTVTSRGTNVVDSTGFAAACAAWRTFMEKNRPKHSKILELLNAALGSPPDQWMDKDKTADQFGRIPGLARSAFSSVKRSKVPDNGEDDKRPQSKKAKKGDSEVDGDDAGNASGSVAT